MIANIKAKKEICDHDSSDTNICVISCICDVVRGQIMFKRFAPANRINRRIPGSRLFKILLYGRN